MASGRDWYFADDLVKARNELQAAHAQLEQQQPDDPDPDVLHRAMEADERYLNLVAKYRSESHNESTDGAAQDG